MSVQTKIDYEYKVSGATAAAAEMNKVGAGADNAANGMDKSKLASESAAEGLDSIITKAAIVAIAYKTMRVAIDFASQSISMAIDANEDMNKFMVVMGDNANVVNTRLETLADTTNRNVFELRALAGGVQDMLVPMGVARGEASGMSADFVQLAIDMSSFNNAPTADVLNAIQSALAGQSRPLRSFGVDTRVAALEQQALAMGIEGTWLQLDQATQAHVLYAKVVADTADAQGDAVRTADEAANVMVGFKSAIDEGKVAIGDEFLPVIEALVPLLRDELGKALPVLKEIAERIATDALRYGPILIQTFGKIIEVVGFAVEQFERLEDIMQKAGGPAVWLLSEGIEYLGDRNVETADTVNWLSDALATALAPFASFNDAVEVSLEYTGDLGEEISILSNYTKELTVAKRDEAMAHIEAARAILIERAALKGYTDDIKADLAKLDTYATIVKETFESVGAATTSVGGGGASGGGSRELSEQEQIIALKLEGIRLDQKMAEQSIARMDMESQLKDAMFAKNMEQRSMELEQVNAQMEPLIAAAQRSTDIIVNGLFGGFDSIKDGFKNMLEDLASEWLKSKVLGLLFGGAGKAATGGLGGFFFGG